MVPAAAVERAWERYRARLDEMFDRLETAFPELRRDLAPLRALLERGLLDRALRLGLH